MCAAWVVVNTFQPCPNAVRSHFLRSSRCSRIQVLCDKMCAERKRSTQRRVIPSLLHQERKAVAAPHRATLGMHWPFATKYGHQQGSFPAVQVLG